MNPPAFLRDFNTKAEMLGFRFDGFTGSGHVKYYNADIEKFVIGAMTPSDWRGQSNCLLRMERFSGRKLPRANAGHHRFRPVRNILDTRLSRVEQQSIDRANDLLAQADEIHGRWIALVSGPNNRTAAAEARELLDTYERIRGELKGLHRIIPPLAVA